MTTAPDGQIDPFGPEMVHAVQAIVQMRIYDVLMALLDATDPDKAEELAELHATGAILSSAPAFNGAFVFDQMKAQENQG